MIQYCLPFQFLFGFSWFWLLGRRILHWNLQGQEQKISFEQINQTSTYGKNWVRRSSFYKTMPFFTHYRCVIISRHGTNEQISNTPNKFFLENLKLPIENLTEETEAFFMVIKDSSKLMDSVALLVFRSHNTKNKFIYFHEEKFLLSLKLPTETLLAESKPENTQKLSLTRDMKHLLTHSGVFGLPGSWFKDWNGSLFSRLVFHFCKFLNWAVDGRSQTGKNEKVWVGKHWFFKTERSFSIRL